MGICNYIFVLRLLCIILVFWALVLWTKPLFIVKVNNYNCSTHLLPDVFVGFWDVCCKRTTSGEESQVAHNTKVCNVLHHLGIKCLNS